MTSSLPRAAAPWLLGLLTIVAPLARGGVDLTIQVALAAGAALGLWLAASGPEPIEVPAVGALLAAALAVTALQAVPVPPAAIRVLSPAAADLFGSTLGPLAAYPAWRSLSLDPPTTAREVAKGAACLAALLAAAGCATSRRQRELLLAALALAGAAVSAAGVGLALARGGGVPEAHAVFVNPNHLAGFLNLSCFVALGFGLRSHFRARLLWLGAFALGASGVFVSLSRGGIAAFFVGVGVFAWLYFRSARREGGGSRLLRGAALPLAVSVALATAVYLVLDPVLAEMGTLRNVSGEAKVLLWPIALRMLWRFPLVGIGRGAFATAFPAYKVDPDPLTYTHVENELIQLPVDLGLPAGLLVLAAVAWTWVRAARQAESRPEIGAVAGMAAVAAHNVVDFSLEVLGVALPFAILLGLVSRGQPVRRLSIAAIRVAAVAAAALAALGAAAYARHPPDGDAARVAAASDVDSAVAMARVAAERHPSDYLPRAIAGTRLVSRGRCAEGLTWLGQAMLLNPTAPEPHRYAARCLAAGGKDALAHQEYGLAYLLGDPLALPEARRRYPALDDLLKIAPDSPDGLLALAEVLEPDRPGDAVRVLENAWDSFHDLRALRSLAESANRSRDDERTLALARQLEERDPGRPRSFRLAAMALGRLGRGEDAREELRRGASRYPGSAEILSPLSDLELAAGHYAAARKLVESIVAGSPGEAALKHHLVARILQRQGRLGEAISEARAARDVLPRSAGVHIVLSDLLAEAGRFDEAIAALEAAASLPDAPAEGYRARTAELRAARDRRAEQLRADQILRGTAEPRPSR